MSSDKGEKLSALSETTSLWDAWSFEIERSRDDFVSEARTIPQLRTPEFLIGTLEEENIEKIEITIQNSKVYKEMCKCWKSISEKSSRTSGSHVREEILVWLKKEIFAHVPVSEDKTLAGNLFSHESRFGFRGMYSFTKIFENLSVCCRSRLSEEETFESDLIAIYVKLRSGEKIQIEVDLKGRVLDIKKKLNVLKGIAPNLQHLFFQGKELDDDERLSEDVSDLKPNCTINLIQIYSILGIPKNVEVTCDSNAPESFRPPSNTDRRSELHPKLQFKPKTFAGTYKWYHDGREPPDVYCGEFVNGTFR